MKWIVRMLLALPLLHIVPVAAGPALDTRFLKEEPYRKTKQRVDLSSIKSAPELAVVKSAIDPVMRFMVGLSFAELPPALPQKLMTENGRRVLRRAPLRNEKLRYSVHRMHNWKVCGETAVSLEATFSDLLGEQFWTEKYLFVESADGWRFDDHREVECASRK